MNEIQDCLNVACQSILRASHLLNTDIMTSGIEIRRAIHELRRANTLIIISDAEARKAREIEENKDHFETFKKTFTAAGESSVSMRKEDV